MQPHLYPNRWLWHCVYAVFCWVPVEDHFEPAQGVRLAGQHSRAANVVERGVILREGDTFSIDDTWLPRVDPKSGSTRAPPVANLIEPEREIIEGALRRARARSQGEPVPQPSSAYPGRRSSRRSGSWESTGIASGPSSRSLPGSRVHAEGSANAETSARARSSTACDA